MTGEPLPRSARRPGTVTRAKLAADLRSLGLDRERQHLLIHCSLGQVGWLDGGPADLLGAITDVTGRESTIVVPAQTTLNSLTSDAFRAATAGLDAEARERYIADMPGFDPARTPSQGVGLFAEHVRTRPSASRSGHPQSSFAAIGPAAAECMSIHDLDCHLGKRSPLGWLYEKHATIVLLGVGYSSCTAFHLAEYDLPGMARRSYTCFTARGETRVAHEFEDIDFDASDFGRLGADLEAKFQHDDRSGLRRRRVGLADCRLVPVRLAVDFARGWLKTNRRPRG